MENVVKEKWYDTSWLIEFTLIVIYPIGLFLLWRTPTINKSMKIVWTIGTGVIFIMNILPILRYMCYV